MFATVITADLPSEEVEGAAPLDDGHSSSHERLSYSTSRLLRTLQQVFEQSEMHDLAFLEIDGQVVYADASESDHADLSMLVLSAQDAGLLDHDFEELVCGVLHWEEGIQHLVEVRVRSAVPVGEPEMTITLVSRPDDLNARRLDDAERYASRLREIIGDLGRVSVMRTAVENVAARLEAALRRTLFRRNIQVGRTLLRVVRPSAVDMASLGSVAFGTAILPPQYQFLPSDAQTTPAWSDPALRVLHDPFLVFRHWVVLDAVMNHGQLRMEWVQIVEPDGRVLFEGHKARWFENWPWGQKYRVSFEPEAGVRVVALG